MTCRVTATVVAWVSATWGGMTGEAGPPYSPDLFLANHRRAWARLARPSRGCGSGCGWLFSPACLRRTGQRRHSRQKTVRAVASSILGHMRAALQRDWLLVGRACAGQAACAQRGTAEGTHGCAGQRSWSAGAARRWGVRPPHAFIHRSSSTAAAVTPARRCSTHHMALHRAVIARLELRGFAAKWPSAGALLHCPVLPYAVDGQSA